MNDIVAGLIRHALTTLGGVRWRWLFDVRRVDHHCRSIGCLHRRGMVCDIQARNRSHKFSTLMIRPLS